MFTCVFLTDHKDIHNKLVGRNFSNIMCARISDTWCLAQACKIFNFHLLSAGVCPSIYLSRSYIVFRVPDGWTDRQTSFSAR